MYGFSSKGKERRERTGVDPFARTMEGAPIEGTPTASGAFDGGGAADTASLFEDEDGNLAIAVQRAANEHFMPIIRGGAVSCLPGFTFHTAPTGRYHTSCGGYGPSCGDAPRTIAMTHDGIIVEGLEDQSRTLCHWSDGEFNNASITE